MKTFSLLTLGIAAFLVCGLISAWPSGHGAPTAATATVATAAVYPDAPDPKLTPGAIRSSDLATIEATEKKAEAERPTQAVKDEVYREYGIDPRHHEPCEIDHRLPLSSGGANDIRNYWPELYASTPGHPGAHVKDRLEEYMYLHLKARTITVTEAQAAFTGDWRAAYVKYIGPLPSK